jgi:hypothetical protein
MVFNLTHSQIILRYKEMAVEANHTIVIMGAPITYFQIDIF